MSWLPLTVRLLPHLSIHASICLRSHYGLWSDLYCIQRLGSELDPDLAQEGRQEGKAEGDELWCGRWHGDWGGGVTGRASPDPVEGRGGELLRGGDTGADS